MDIQSVLNVETNALAVVYFRASNRLIFPFSLSHHIGKSSFSISIYMEEVFQQIDFPFLYIEMSWLPFLLEIEEKLLVIEIK